ncbi:MAG: 1-acyl-sn-glycerol-3-phosphate acyltransferase [Desulfobacterales bacterium]|nr:1-acyl-sn-glycerol-3-phosphate acyltransferase [Desulfobacterales bacterium]
MLNRFISIGIITFIGVSSALFYLLALVIWVLTVCLDRRLVILHMFTSFWAVLYLWVVPAWQVSVSGRDRVRPGVTYMVVSNHQSQLDILVAFKLFFPFKWVSKAAVFKLPFIGWNMVLNRYIKIKRGRKDSIALMMKACEKSLAAGNSVYFFPEGTRSKTGIVKPFKYGAFTLAKKMKVPILPIVINGTKNALPKNSLNFHGRHAIHIKVLEEIPVETFASLPVAELAEMVRKVIIGHVAEHQKN